MVLRVHLAPLKFLLDAARPSPEYLPDEVNAIGQLASEAAFGCCCFTAGHFIFVESIHVPLCPWNAHFPRAKPPPPVPKLIQVQGEPIHNQDIKHQICRKHKCIESVCLRNCGIEASSILQTRKRSGRKESLNLCIFSRHRRQFCLEALH